MDDLEPDDADKDNLTLLNEILNAPASQDEFSREWAAVFGDAPTPASATGLATSHQQDSRPQQADFLPSNLLDVNQSILNPTPAQGLLFIDETSTCRGFHSLLFLCLAVPSVGIGFNKDPLSKLR